MTFLVIKEQNFHLVVCSADVYARKNGESGKCNGTWPNRSSIAIPMQPRRQGFPPKKMGGPTHFLRTRLIPMVLRTGAITKWRNTKDWKTLNITHSTTQKRANNGFRSLYSSACASNPPPPPATSKTTKSDAPLLVIQGKEVKKKIHRSAYDDNVLLRWKEGCWEGNLYNDKLHSWH